jgi:hypothetical protein
MIEKKKVDSGVTFSVKSQNRKLNEKNLCSFPTTMGRVTSGAFMNPFAEVQDLECETLSELCLIR